MFFQVIMTFFSPNFIWPGTRLAMSRAACYMHVVPSAVIVIVLSIVFPTPSSKPRGRIYVVVVLREYTLIVELVLLLIITV